MKTAEPAHPHCERRPLGPVFWGLSMGMVLGHFIGKYWL